MKFTIEKNGFVKILQRIQGIVEKRNTMPILANVLLEASNDNINIMATDLEVFIKDSSKASISEDGQITVNARKIFEIVKELPGETIDVATGKDDRITLKAGKAKFTIMGLPAKDFPVFPVFEETHLENIENEVLREMIDKTSFAVSTDETRYNINGFLFEKDGQIIRMVATDGHRLACIEKKNTKISIGEKQSVLLPRKGVIEIKKVLDEKDGNFLFGISQKNAVLKKENTCINIRLLEGEFPDYKKVIPKDNNKTVIADRETLLSSLKRVSILSSEKIKGVKFSFNTSKLILSSSSPDIGEAIEEEEIEYNGETIDISFNARYLIDMLESTNEEKIRIELKDSLSPGIVKSLNSDDYVYIIMPMRL